MTITIEGNVLGTLILINFAIIVKLESPTSSFIKENLGFFYALIAVIIWRQCLAFSKKPLNASYWETYFNLLWPYEY